MSVVRPDWASKMRVDPPSDRFPVPVMTAAPGTAVPAGFTSLTLAALNCPNTLPASASVVLAGTLTMPPVMVKVPMLTGVAPAL